MSCRRGYLREDGVWLTEGNAQRHSPRNYSQICLVPKCDQPTKELGLCNKHYLQLRAGIIDNQGNKLRDFIKRPRKDRWQGQDGYVLVPAPSGHPRPRTDGSILQHRLVMEQHLGRYLEEWEIVRHKDGNRSHNEWHNLELLDGRAKNGGPGHPPGSDFSVSTAVQVLLQRTDIPEGLRKWLDYYWLTDPIHNPTQQAA